MSYLGLRVKNLTLRGQTTDWSQAEYEGSHAQYAKYSTLNIQCLTHHNSPYVSSLFTLVMKFAFTPRLVASLAALVMWALVAGSVLYWVWRVYTPPMVNAPVAGLTSDAEQAINAQAVARALGAAGTHVATDAGDATGRFTLRGVITHGPDSGAALIAVDGKPPKPVRVGAPVVDVDGWTLRTVTPNGAVLASGVHEVTLAVPQPDPQRDTHADADSDLRAPAVAPLPMDRRGPGLMMQRPLQP